MKQILITTIRLLSISRYIFFLFLVVVLFACSKSSSNNPGPVSEIDINMVGTWKGTGNGTSTTGAPETLEIVLMLKNDGSFVSTGSQPGLVCNITGTWKVSGATFSALGTFGTGCEIHGTLSLNAPKSTTVLKGTYTENLATGNFELTKQ